ncbi:error-prone DNA polymerase [Sphingomonas sp. ID1715]|uniref:error-prone DNA polymerase n=1 Tax=Sphingomonas sp. ID1715 TaxID=1656898 RepID=UPI001489C4B2|nr:error-prone DNA polymerase [Sphingomonas sp. ID1715]NNM78128.1 error-prone DNA polymerase [Sphingomonas sp. ID1715]
MYTELNVTTHFSFLRGASSCDELFAAAALLGYKALGITDHNSIGGLVRALIAADATGIRAINGCRLDLMDGNALLVWPEDRAGWSSLTRLLTAGKLRADPAKGEKGQCFLHWEDVEAHADGLVAALITNQPDDAARIAMGQIADLFGDRGHVALAHHRRPGDPIRLHRLAAMGRSFGLKPLATGNVLYHSPDRRLLQDVMTAIRNKCTIDELGFRRERHADRHLKGPEEMARLFRSHPDAIRASAEIAERCTFSLRELSYQYPEEVVMSGRSPQQALERLTWTALQARFPEGVPDAYSKLLTHELRLVGQLDYAPYFLTVNSIVGYARSQGIMCQGRGSAANSMICFVLGITSIDPVHHKLLFERFISGERREPPDIDVDFEHEQREEVIQWIYRTYGHEHAALTAVVSRFRARGAVREVGKALGLPEDLTGALAGQVWGWSQEGVGEKHVEQLNLDTSDPRIRLTLDLSRELIGTPRHLSQHPGGFVLTRDRLDSLLTVERAAMPNRWVIGWEKEDIEELKFMKVDVLGLGMLGCMRRAFDLLKAHKGIALDLASPEMQEDDPEVYRMIQRADTLGVFQIESRAQMSMLPRMKPKEFYDLVIEVAIVRPGPIQGDMVHPYLRRREGKEPAIYPSDELREVLEKTLGVPLFQEQAMKVAIVGAGFTPAEADALRRSMATFKFTGGVSHFRDKLVNGMIAKGYSPEFADRTFRQIEGFGSYGFPESHAASFAKIAYASSWMKCHHPDIFCAALLNAQPMGFYAPAQIVRDARAHGVKVLPPDVNDSGWDTVVLSEEYAQPRSLRAQSRSVSSRTQGFSTSLETNGEADRLWPLRLGLRVVRGLAADHGAAIIAARGDRPYASIEEVWRRSRVPVAALERLAEADAFAGLGVDRRQALWQVRGLGHTELPLFAAVETREEPVALRPMTAGREVVEDYRSTQLSLRAHPLSFLRPELKRRGMVACADLDRVRDGRRVELAGIILVRQKPGSAKGVLFITIEDETGVANLIVWPDRFEAQRRTIMSSAMISVVGKVQKEGQVIHIITETVADETALLRSVGEMDFPHRPGPGDGATHGGSPDRGEAGWEKRVRDSYHKPFRTGADPEDVIKVKTRDFH